MLSRREIAAFERDGLVVLPAAVPRRVTAACRTSIRHRLAAMGVDTADPSTWTRPLVHIPWPATAGFDLAAHAPALTEAYDQLIGPGAWTHLPTVGGTVPIRFPDRRRLAAAPWHVDGTFARDGEFITSIESPSRGALCLILLGDISPDDAPTELKVGSHLDVAPVLAPFGADGCHFAQVGASLPPSTFERPTRFVTGRAGDIYLCHPFLLHRTGTRHRGDRPRYLAQPGMMVHRPFRLEGGRPRAVERSIRVAVAGAAPTPSRPSATKQPTVATRRRSSTPTRRSGSRRT